MSDIQFDFEIKRSVAEWNKATEFNSREFFITLAQVAANVAVVDAKGTLEKSLDLLRVVLNNQSESTEPAVLAWELINIALYGSIIELLSENTIFIEEPTKHHGPEDLADLLVQTMNRKSVGLNADFFEHPKNIELLETIQQPLADWLVGLGIPSSAAKSICLRLKDRFVINLHKQWIANFMKYAVLESSLKSPFISATQQQREWTLYSAWLQEQANMPVFSEAFGLREIYVPLRGYYILTEEEKISINELNQNSKRKTKKHNLSEEVLDKQISLDFVIEKKYEAVDVHSDIMSWVSNFDRNNAVKVICGGPGAGKSSFAKVLSSELVEKMPHIPVLFVPLQHFDISGDLTTAVSDFIKDDRYLSTNPLDGKNGQDRLVIIFDGLDELSMQGKAASESARAFVEEVLIKIDRFNGQGFQRQALITGRDIAIQACEEKLRGKRKVLHLLPYKLDYSEIYEIFDPLDILSVDQRDIWWEKYSKAKGFEYKSIPNDLKEKNLEPITIEPLLNYLVALTYERGEIDFSNEVTLNEVYADLLKSVHQRQWDSGYHKGTGNLAVDKFERVLEEIALAVWHGHGRTASLNSIEEQCKESNLLQYLREFEQSAESGIARLLTAFYFRQSDTQISSDKTFEFTHKSFGEYLTAKRIVTLIKNIDKNLKRYDEDPDDGFSEREAIKQLVKICGVAPLDYYIVDFIKNAVALYNVEVVKSWQRNILRLIAHCLDKNLPMHEFPSLTYQQMMIHASNTLETLIVLNHCFSNSTNEKTDIFLGVNIIDWANFITYSRKGQSSLIYEYLTHLIIEDYSFSDISMNGVNLSSSNLVQVDMENVNLDNSLIKFSNIDQCKFAGTSLNDACFEYSLLTLVEFNNCDLIYTDFDWSNLNHVDFSTSTVDGVLMSFAEVNNIILPPNVSEISFNYSVLSYMSLENRRFSNCDFSNSDLVSINAIGSEFINCTFESAEFNSCIFTGCSFIKCDFTDAILSDIDLSSVTFDQHTTFPSNYSDILTREQCELYESYLEKRKEDETEEERA